MNIRKQENKTLQKGNTDTVQYTFYTKTNTTHTTYFETLSFMRSLNLSCFSCNKLTKFSARIPFLLFYIVFYKHNKLSVSYLMRDFYEKKVYSLNGKQTKILKGIHNGTTTSDSD